ncbi:MAG: amidohydrolase family protein [Lachnospiraceae bacterium]|nr:amidohydrolase family protein [Lachnospiraceae bacterium]
MREDFVIKGDICFSLSANELITREDSFLVCTDGKVAGIFDKLPERFENLKLYDYSGKLVIPGMSDLHVHASQYAYRGLGMDLELLDWLNTITFPHEARYEDVDFAKKAYGIFVDDMLKSETTRACIFATVHVPATIALMDLFEKTGLKTYVGKVNMDRNCADCLRETSAGSAEDTRQWIEAVNGRYENVRPIITPRFIPSCTDGLMRELSDIRARYDLPVQSHLSENLSEIEWVRELCPWSESYPDAYLKFGMLGGDTRTVMAHCVHVNDEETDLLAERGVYVAHSPQSNENLRSGVAPIKKMLKRGVKVGLATDVAGGSSLSMFRAVTDAIQCSKLRWRLSDDSFPALSMDEAFFLATKGSGEFFGKVGSFEEGYEFDAVVLDDSMLKTVIDLSLRQRLERVLYLSNGRGIEAKFVSGTKVL